MLQSFSNPDLGAVEINMSAPSICSHRPYLAYTQSKTLSDKYLQSNNFEHVLCQVIHQVANCSEADGWMVTHNHLHRIILPLNVSQ